MSESYMRIDLEALGQVSEVARAATDESIDDATFRALAREKLDGVRVRLDPTDFTIEWEDNTGPFGPTVFLLHPHNEAAREWMKEHLPEDVQWFGESVVVEHRYIEDIRDGIVADGLRVASVRI